jgi:hypothetical protein
MRDPARRPAVHPSAPLSRLLLAHAVVTLAAAMVLVVAPGAIPSAVGIDGAPGSHLVAYLLAAAELGFAVLSFRARRLADPAALRVVVDACVALHAASALLEAYALARGGVSAAVWANVAARGVIIALFLRFRPSR